VIRQSTHSRFPVVEGDLDGVIGIVHVKELFMALESGRPLDLRALSTAPLIVPETTPALDVLERLQQTGEQMALVVDEHGGIDGMVTLTDLMQAVVGDLRGPGEGVRSRLAKIADGSWQVDGAMPISDVKEALEWREIPGEEDGFTTLGGLVLAHLHRIPAAGDSFTIDGWKFEVVAMEGNRVDRVVITKVAAEG
jgi:putative hemolysin